MRYLLPGIQLETDFPIEAYAPFQTEECSTLPITKLVFVTDPYRKERVLDSFPHKQLSIAVLESGWLYCSNHTEEIALGVSKDYSKLTAYVRDPESDMEKLQPLLRTAIECASAYNGVVSLHSASVELDGKAVCFTAPSGTGKSTRAGKWVDLFGAEMISGDRPSISVKTGRIEVCGVPWDGKEQIFRNVRFPLLAICNLRRSHVTRIRRLSPKQARRVLMRQCSIPMWDTETSASVMLIIERLCSLAPFYRVLCGPDDRAAEEVRDILYGDTQKIHGIENDMKIKNGFVLRNVTGEYIVMPTGQNIKEFDGAIVLNEVAAFVWNKMQDSVSREELLTHILAEFDVSEECAAKDLDALLQKLRGYGVIEDETT